MIKFGPLKARWLVSNWAIGPMRLPNLYSPKARPCSGFVIEVNQPNPCMPLILRGGKYWPMNRHGNGSVRQFLMVLCQVLMNASFLSPLEHDFISFLVIFSDFVYHSFSDFVWRDMTWLYLLKGWFLKK